MGLNLFRRKEIISGLTNRQNSNRRWRKKWKVTQRFFADCKPEENKLSMADNFFKMNFLKAG
jgi:hypothetical protein